MNTRRRWFAIGDPQTTFEKFLAILRGHGLLDARDRLRDDVGLVSAGAHFDFSAHGSGRALADVGRDGTNILRWLADHPRDPVAILMGNHDAARVMELAHETDESFARARELAESGTPEEFVRAFPRIPTPDIAGRDYSSFATHQREVVQELLLDARMQLAVVGRFGGRDVLLTHASVTDVQVEQLGVASTANAIAEALGRLLAAAVGHVRSSWERGEAAVLDLRPVHVPGEAGREGGGLLYHRASSRESDASSCTAPRRYHPARLPRGLVQVCGHTGHHKSRQELAEWLSPAARERRRGGLRTLSVGSSGIGYELGIEPARDDEATLYLIDIEMNAPEVTDYPLFPLEDVGATAVATPR